MLCVCGSDEGSSGEGDRSEAGPREGKGVTFFYPGTKTFGNRISLNTEIHGQQCLRNTSDGRGDEEWMGGWNAYVNACL